MNILGNNSSKLNEVIFENRNKNYGAYAIRESYNDSLKKSLIGLSSILFLLFGSAYAYNKINAVAIEDKPIVFDDLKPEVTTIVDLRPIVELPPATPEAAAPRGVTTPTTIIDDAPESPSVTLTENPNPGLGNENSTGTSTSSTISSTNTAVTTTTFHIVEETPTVVIADEMPVFNADPNGILKYVSSNITYPEMAKNIGIEGTVYVSFVVSELGKVENAKVMRGIGYGCDEEVLKIVNKMPTWMKAGKNAGKAVKVRYNIPVRFKLN